MVKINRIYTRTGDDGTTGLVGGGRTQKDSLRVTAYGEVDEVLAHMGAISTLAKMAGRTLLTSQLSFIMQELFDIGAELATPPGAEWEGMMKTGGDHIAQLEEWIDTLMKGIPELRSFVLPGGNLLNSHIHIARTVCRRAERAVTTLLHQEPVNPFILHYLNRLSDLLFAMARYESSVSGTEEILWVPRGKRV